MLRNDPEYLAVAQSATAHDEQSTRAWFQSAKAEQHIRVAKDDSGRAVGYARIVRPEEDEPVVDVMVARTHRGQGVADALLESLFLDFAKRPLYTYCHKDNPKGYWLFRRHGFRDAAFSHDAMFRKLRLA